MNDVIKSARGLVYIARYFRLIKHVELIPGKSPVLKKAASVGSFEIW